MARRGMSLVWLIVFCCSTARGGDWPWFHGPTHDRHAVSEPLLERWPTDGPPVVWARSLGVGYSSFAIVSGRAYTQTQSLYDQAVECIDVRTGRTLWRRRYSLPYDGGGLYPGPRSTPAVSDGCVYYHSPEGAVGCLRAEDGESLWSVHLKSDFGLRGTDFGCSSSPVVVGGRLYIPAGGEGAMLVALDAASGRLLWKSGNHPASYATPLPIEWQGQQLLIVPGENTLAAFHAESGELWWELELSSGYDEHSCAPLYREPRLMLASPFRAGARQWELVRNPQTGHCEPVTVWDQPKFSNDVASSVLVQDAIYGFDLRDAQSRLNRASRGEFRCLDWLTGKILWSTREVGHANVIVADDKLILFDDVGRLTMTRASREGYVELGRMTVLQEETCWSAPALAGGYLLIRSPTRVVCLDLGMRSAGLRTGETRGSREPPSSPYPPVGNRPVVIPKAARRFDPTWLIGGEREYPATTPEYPELWSWYAWSIAGLAGAGVLASVAGGLVRWRRGASDSVLSQHNEAGRRVVFWGVIVLWGTLGSPLLNRVGDNGTPDPQRYVFLWPMILWAALEAALAASRSARGASFRSARKWRSYAAGCGFLGVCGLYFHLCRLLGLAPEWSFLTGPAAALPVILIGAALVNRQTRWKWPVEWAAAALSFSAFFWGSIGFMKWRMTMGN